MHASRWKPASRLEKSIVRHHGDRHQLHQQVRVDQPSDLNEGARGRDRCLEMLGAFRLRRGPRHAVTCGEPFYMVYPPGRADCPAERTFIDWIAQARDNVA